MTFNWLSWQQGKNQYIYRERDSTAQHTDIGIRIALEFVKCRYMTKTSINYSNYHQVHLYAAKDFIYCVFHIPDAQ